MLWAVLHRNLYCSVLLHLRQTTTSDYPTANSILAFNLNQLELIFMYKLGMINHLKLLEKTQNVLKCRILEHFLNWKSITRVNKSKTPFFPISPCNRNPLDFFKFCNAASRNGLYNNGCVISFFSVIKILIILKTFEKWNLNQTKNWFDKYIIIITKFVHKWLWH